MKTVERVSFEACINIIDAEGVKEEYSGHTGSSGTIIESALYLLTNTHEPPEKNGYKIVNKTLDLIDGTKYRLHVTADIVDPNIFEASARECMAECFGESTAADAKGDSYSSLLSEIVTISNASDSPASIGYVVISTSDTEPHSDLVPKSKHISESALGL